MTCLFLQHPDLLIDFLEIHSIPAFALTCMSFHRAVKANKRCILIRSMLERMDSFVYLSRTFNLSRNDFEAVECLEKFPEFIRYCNLSASVSDSEKFKNLFPPDVLSDRQWYYLKNLTSLELCWRNLPRFSKWPVMSYVRHLHFYRCHLDLKNVEKYPNVLYLKISRCTGHIHLHLLPKLRKLTIDDCNLAELQVTPGKMKELELRNIIHRDPMDWISHCTHLYCIQIKNVVLQPFPPIDTLTALEKLIIMDYHWPNQLSNLRLATSLKRLVFHHSFLTDISFVETLTELIELDLSGNEITDISPLKNLTKLSVLYLDGNRLSKISALRKLKRLKRLKLDQNRIQDHRPLAVLSLQYCDLK
jgi:Leucine-rich repeat (LRR) protein